MGEIFKFEDFMNKAKSGKFDKNLIPDEKPLDVINLKAPKNTFEIGKMYDFNPSVSSHAFWDEERTPTNAIGSKNFSTGTCLKFLKHTEYGPLFLFSGVLNEEPGNLQNNLVVYFGVIYNKTDPNRSHAIDDEY